MDEMIASTYRIIEKIGSGGGGTVYLADHIRLGKKVVLKADKKELSAGRELLRKEVDILKELKHKNIPQVYDFFIEDGVVYTVMDYIEGESLDKPLKRGERFLQPQVISWALQLLDALDYLHRPIHGTPPKGYVHSDVKPANIMRRPDQSICLIDFNIALALGDTKVIGLSMGYSSPEHYGKDYSFGSTTTSVRSEQWKSEAADKDTSEQSTRKKIVPDVRSDIYSLGATLYHLLSGKRPHRDAVEVEPLSKEEISPPLVEIITKAMDPNPDLRYQSAAEMRDAILKLRKNDPRMKGWKRECRIAQVLFPILIGASIAAGFVGVKRIQVTEESLKLAEYAKNDLREGNVEGAKAQILQAFSEKETILTPRAGPVVQRTLAEVLGLYDLSDGYKQQGIVELPSELIGVELSPDGQTAICICSGEAVILDVSERKIEKTLPLVDSAMAEAAFLDEHRILYAGKEGLCCYDLKEDKVCWQGKPATQICVSADKKTAAAIYRDDSEAFIYDTADGSLKKHIDFEGRKQLIVANDVFWNPQYNLLALSADGDMLAVSFADGTLMLYELQQKGQDWILLDDTSGYSIFGGGFSGKYFAFSATGQSSSAAVFIDTETMKQVDGFQSQSSTYRVQADENGIYVQSGNLLAKVDPESGQQQALASLTVPIQQFCTDGSNTMVTTSSEIVFYDSCAREMSQYQKETGNDVIAMAGATALIGSVDSSVVRILETETFSDKQVFSYDPAYSHSETRVSADGNTVMQFSHDQFRVYQITGELLAEVDIPEADQLYDQQFRRDGEKSWLEVTWNDGLVRTYDAADGSMLEEYEVEKPDRSLYEEFDMDRFHLEVPLHGDVRVYDQESGELVKVLDEAAYLTYVTQVGDYTVVQYLSTDAYSYPYGLLYDENWEVLAELPYLCDVQGEELYFDYPSGYVRKTRIYHIEEMEQIVKEEKENERNEM